jgi:hypothetical protein
MHDPSFKRIDELAGRLRKRRGEALADYASHREPEAVTRALDEIGAELSDEGSAFAAEAARRTLERSEW